MTTALLNLIALIIIAGIFLWVVGMFIPMPASIQSLLHLVIIIILLLYILQYFAVIKPMLPVIQIFR